MSEAARIQLAGELLERSLAWFNDWTREEITPTTAHMTADGTIFIAYIEGDETGEAEADVQTIITNTFDPTSKWEFRLKHVPSEDPLAGKVVVGIAPPADEALHATILLGVPVDAWHYMKDGKTHTFDLREAGVPVQILMFGGTDHANIIETLQMATDNTGKPLLATDQEIQDLGINVPEDDGDG